MLTEFLACIGNSFDFFSIVRKRLEINFSKINEKQSFTSSPGNFSNQIVFPTAFGSSAVFPSSNLPFILNLFEIRLLISFTYIFISVYTFKICSKLLTSSDLLPK